MTDAERTALSITTIGALEVDKAELAECRKLKQCEADRIHQAKA